MTEDDGLPIETVGAVLSTVKVVLGPAAAAVLPAVSEAVPVPMEMPKVPLPVMLDNVTVRLVPLPVTETLPALAEPVLFTVTLPLDNVELPKLASE